MPFMEGLGSILRTQTGQDFFGLLCKLLVAHCYFFFCPLKRAEKSIIVPSRSIRSMRVSAPGQIHTFLPFPLFVSSFLPCQYFGQLFQTSLSRPLRRRRFFSIQICFLLALLSLSFPAIRGAPMSLSVRGVRSDLSSTER